MLNEKQIEFVIKTAKSIYNIDKYNQMTPAELIDMLETSLINSCISEKDWSQQDNHLVVPKPTNELRSGEMTKGG